MRPACLIVWWKLQKRCGPPVSSSQMGELEKTDEVNPCSKVFVLFRGKIKLLVELIEAVEMLLLRDLRANRMDVAVSMRCFSQIEPLFETAERHAGLS